MKQTWHRADASIGKKHEPGFLSVFLKYDLRHWTFGIAVDPDDLWLPVYFYFGPFEVEFCYWRHYVCVLDDATDTGSVT